METRHFAKMGAPLSLLGFGCMRLPTKEDGRIDYDEGYRMVDLAIAHGVNYFDTAYWYHDFESERFIGEALRRHAKEKWYLATKMPVIKCKTREDPPRFFQEQLDRCGVERFDYYLAHSLERTRMDAFVDCDCFAYMKEEQARGRIGKIGFSFHDTPAVLEGIIDAYDWDFVQLQLNYLDWTVQDAAASYEIVRSRGLPCTVMEPVRGGFLARLPDGCGEILTGADPAASHASWALRWVASLDNIAVTLSGMSNLAQVEDNLATFEPFRPLNDGEKAVVDRVLDQLNRLNAIPCTKCRYCVGCPKGIDIPAMFDLYNRYKLFGETFRVKFTYSQMEDRVKGHHCVGCGYCVEQCPQHLDIPALLQQTEELFAEFRQQSSSRY